MLLRNKDKERLFTIFASIEVPLEVWAYGSRVDGTAHEGSDLDLVIRTHNLKKLPTGLLRQLREMIRESQIPILVDLFEWANLAPGYQRNIEIKHELLFSNLKDFVQNV